MPLLAPLTRITPINYDTSNGYANYNVPQVPPSFNNKAGDAFFDKVNYVGAFAGTQKTTDNWTAGWANWTPTTTNYEYVGLAVNTVNVSSNIYAAKVVPNPTFQPGYFACRFTCKKRVEHYCYRPYRTHYDKRIQRFYECWFRPHSI